MQTLEWMMVFSALLATLALLANPIQEKHTFLDTSTQKLEIKFHQLACSSKHNRANSHFVRVTAGDCVQYPYILRENVDPFALFLGEDANHYD